MKIFIAGVMQSNRTDDQIDDQSYRSIITEALEASIPNVEVLDPWALNPDSVNYSDEQAFNTFHSMTKLAGTADYLIAYLPRPSMGTAMEMWEARQHGVPIIAITPYIHHWAIKHVATTILPDLDTLLTGIRNRSIL